MVGGKPGPEPGSLCWVAFLDGELTPIHLPTPSSPSPAYPLALPCYHLRMTHMCCSEE